MNLENRINFINYFPCEINGLIFRKLSIKTLLSCRELSKSWKQTVEYDGIWKSKFEDQKYWKYFNDNSETDSWYELYKERYLLDLNWKNDNFTAHILRGHSSGTECVKFYKNWIITGSQDCTIRIWDSETFQCLKVISEPGPEILKKLGIAHINHLIDHKSLSQTKIWELTKNFDINFHLDYVTSIDINDKYMVSGSMDGVCIIWKLPDFNLISRLKMPQGLFILSINDVALYKDYIVCYSDREMWVWKSDIDNLENQLQFNLQYILVGKSWKDICIHNDIIYGHQFGDVIKSWNIETGQIIQEFRGDKLGFMTVKDQNLFATIYDNQITVQDLQSNKLINIIPDDEGFICSIVLLMVDNRIICYDNGCTIRVWNLNDLKLFKKIKKSDLHTLLFLDNRKYSIDADSKKMAVVYDPNGDVVIYDYTKYLRKKYLKHL